jgi:hypothetical protein
MVKCVSTCPCHDVADFLVRFVKHVCCRCQYCVVYVRPSLAQGTSYLVGIAGYIDDVFDRPMASQSAFTLSISCSRKRTRLRDGSEVQAGCDVDDGIGVGGFAYAMLNSREKILDEHLHSTSR